MNNVIDFDLDKHEWHLDPLLVVGSNREKIQAELDKVYRSKNHFLPYSIGGWVAAYGRLQLYEALRELRPFCASCYFDTDSVYFNDHRGIEVFEKLNEGIASHLLSIYNEDEIAPRDKKGNRHMIGLWDPQFDGKSVRFITFGSKKYFYQENEKPHVNHITVAGLNKNKGAEYLTQLAGGEILIKKDEQGRVISKTPVGGAFCETVDLGFKWPEEWSGRTVAQYSEEEYTMTINGDVCTEQSWLAILPTTYELGETSIYKLERLLAADYAIRER